jgi:glycosyltransferase involved in cell wall biosynthesis
MVKTKSSVKTIIGMPAYNEERTITGVILQAKEYADKVIVVNDGSPDNTSKLAKLAGAEVIEHESNKGYGAAIRTILAEAVKQNADILVIIDADAQHNPNEIPLLINGILEGADLVIGSRKMQRDSTPGYRWMGQKILARFTNIAARQNLSDTESGFRAYSKKAITGLKLNESGMAVSAEIISEASRIGLKITEVPITVSYDNVKSSKNPILHGLGNLSRIFVFISERRPLLFFSIAGGLLILVGIVAGIFVIKEYYTSYILATGTALLSMLFFTVGIFCVFTGVVLNVINKRLGK